MGDTVTVTFLWVVDGASVVDTGTGWYGYAAPTPAQPGYPEQEAAYYAAYPAPQDPMAGQWATMPPPEPQYGYQPQPQPYSWEGYASAGYATPQQHPAYGPSYPAQPFAAYEQEFQQTTQVFDAQTFDTAAFDTAAFPLAEPAWDSWDSQESEPDQEPEPEPTAEPEPVLVGAGGRAATRASRGRTGRRRSALLTIAVPSIAVLGIAGGAAAALVPRTGSHAVAANDASTKLTAKDRQAQAEAAAQARAAAEQVSRDQARQALTLRTAAAKRAAAEAPRYVLPITAHVGLSALFGQAGTHWLSLHTGIDFPVSTGTQVHAVTDGTISTKWNVYYGNMLILTAPDGTQTWYCHLSAYKKRSGSVKAGDVIAYSGDTGNSTGPHLHFEVHPHGGAAIDPLPWLLSHGLDPR
jgi:murein DD-endopeptidase MepM/ murein hydrolase activator NlpD